MFQEMQVAGGGGELPFNNIRKTGTKVSNGVITFDISDINSDGSKVLFEDIFPVISAIITHSANNYDELVTTTTWTQSADGKTLTLTLGGNAPSLIYATRGWNLDVYYR